MTNKTKRWSKCLDQEWSTLRIKLTSVLAMVVVCSLREQPSFPDGKLANETVVFEIFGKPQRMERG